jgi:hypothetical protein
LDSQERPTTFAGVARVHPRRGPEMLVWCAGCHKKRWVEYGELRCHWCRVSRRSAKRRGGLLLSIAGLLLYGLVASFASELPTLVELPVAIGALAVFVVGIRRTL